MKTLILFITTMAFFGCGLKDESLLSCDDWTHPSSKGDIISANPGSSYNVGQVLSVNFTPVDPLVEPIWEKKELEKNGYTGNNVGFVKVNIPEDGDYTVWTTSKAFITYINSENKAQAGGNYITNCKKELKEGGYLLGVSFNFKAGVNKIQLSHSKDKNSVVTVTKTQ